MSEIDEVRSSAIMTDRHFFRSPGPTTPVPARRASVGATAKSPLEPVVRTPVKTKGAVLIPTKATCASVLLAGKVPTVTSNGMNVPPTLALTVRFPQQHRHLL